MIKQLFVLLTAAVLGFYQLPNSQDNARNKSLETTILREQIPNYAPVFNSPQQTLDELMCQYLNISGKDLKKMKSGTKKWSTSKGGLVKLPDKYLLDYKRDATNESRLLEPVALAFQEMADSAKKEGIKLLLGSGYRDKSEQAVIYAQSNGNRQVAPPGGSNHQKAIALDLAGPEGFIKKGSIYRWLIKHASKYGFENPPWAKGINGPREQWHWEYDTSKLKAWYSEQIQTRDYSSEMQREVNNSFSIVLPDILDRR